MDYSQYYVKRQHPKFNVGEVTKWLIIICAIATLISLFLPEEVMLLLLYNSENLFNYPWILITNVFFHGSIEHLFVNCWGLFILGTLIESRQGSNFMTKLFFLSVIISNILFGILNPGVYGLGISGFVYALIGSAVIFSPNTRLYVFPLPISLPISLLGPLFLLLEIVLGFVGSDGIGHVAHAVGFIVGLLLSLYVKKKSPPVYERVVKF